MPGKAFDDKAFDENALAAVRQAYARRISSVAEVSVAGSAMLEKAFATVPRENFLGPPPWTIMRPPGGFRDVAEYDPVLLYQDVLVALAPERGVNNGSPSLHAHWLSIVGLNKGDRVAHIGAGAGYYTAIIAHLVGEGGRVTAVEYDMRLAEMARRNLGAYRNVSVVEADGVDWPREETDCVYVNFAVTRPAGPWLERLSPRGRLIFPLGAPRSTQRRTGAGHSPSGAAFLISRAPGKSAFVAKWAGQAYFVFAEGALGRSADDSAVVLAAFEGGSPKPVRSLRWKMPPSPKGSWLVGRDWSLSTEAP